jgi:hypothetical protein
MTNVIAIFIVLLNFIIMGQALIMDHDKAKNNDT